MSEALITHYLHSVSYPEEKFYSRLLIEAGLTQKELRELKNQHPRKISDTSHFTFIDLFAGIGGMRLAAESLGGRCVFSSEWDAYAQKTYQANFQELPFGDITSISETHVPKHNILFAGFPCQAFSIAGKKGGFNDTRGTLFFDVARIIKSTRPDAFILENVKGLLNHDSGKTLETILNVLRNDLGYHVPDPQIINSKYFGVPQNRERIFIVGFKIVRKDKQFTYPKGRLTTKTINGILERTDVSAKYYLSKQYLRTLERHKARHQAKGNGFGYQVLKSDAVANAIVVGGMGRERNLVVHRTNKALVPVTNIQGTINSQFIRRLTPRECARLQGFPESYKIPVSDAQAYKQFGNSVSVPSVQAVLKKVLEVLG